MVKLLLMSPLGTEQYVGVKKVVVHKGFKLTKEHDDISLIELSNDAKASDYISTICLPEAGEEPRHDTICAVTGICCFKNSF